ncbi:hypothetical protein ACFSL6_03615 [Paenibacillus thailandensis]|uniref:Uncharacterized protein n=1 Tax=Paenibacillus thailandensis TaxID=393250 RepID=A0ABW5R4U8_9BACL
MNDDSLDSPYSGSNYTGGIALWNDSSANVNIIDSAWSTSNADLISVEEDIWNENGWGNGSAWTQPVRDDGLICAEYPTSSGGCGSSDTIDYAV